MLGHISKCWDCRGCVLVEGTFRCRNVHPADRDYRKDDIFGELPGIEHVASPVGACSTGQLREYVDPTPDVQLPDPSLVAPTGAQPVPSGAVPPAVPWVQ